MSLESLLHETTPYTTPATSVMSFEGNNSCNHHGTGRKSRKSSGNGHRRSAMVPLFTVLLLSFSSSEGKFSSLASIPTHHGVNANLHFNGGGGAVARRRRRRHGSSGVPKSPSTGELGSISEEQAVPQSTPSTTFSISSSSTWSPAENNVATKEQQSGAPASPAAPLRKEFKVRHRKPSQNEGLSPAAIVCMSLLALQFGIQPILVRKYTPQTVVRSSVVLVQELVKFGIAGWVYMMGTEKEGRKKDFEGWSVKTWVALAGLPAFLYTIQNMASLMAYQNLEALTFNVLNQTKILSAALSCYFVMGKRQSKMQVFSLCLLILSTLVIERIVHPSAFVSLFASRGEGAAFGLTNALKGMSSAFSSLKNSTGKRVSHGIVPIMVASLISGLAGALTQLNLQGGASKKPMWGKRSSKISGSSSSTKVESRPPRNAYLFSMEMNIASVLLLLGSLLCSSEGRSILKSGSFFSEWTPQTFIPVITNAIGGILVGLVTKHAGSVRKGFALIFGLLLSGLFQASGTGIRREQIVGGSLAALSLWMHTAHPHKGGNEAKKVNATVAVRAK